MCDKRYLGGLKCNQRYPNDEKCDKRYLGSSKCNKRYLNQVSGVKCDQRHLRGVKCDKKYLSGVKCDKDIFMVCVYCVAIMPNRVSPGIRINRSTQNKDHSNIQYTMYSLLPQSNPYMFFEKYMAFIFTTFINNDCIHIICIYLFEVHVLCSDICYGARS